MFRRRMGGGCVSHLPPSPPTVCLPRLLSVQTARFPRHLINKEKFAFGANCRENQFAGDRTFNKMQFYNCLRDSGDPRNYVSLVSRNEEIEWSKNHSYKVYLHIHK